MRDGDCNTNFFHRRASARRRKNRIVGLKGHNGEWYEDEAGIERVVTDYFSNIFSFTHPLADGEILDAINMKVTKDMNTSLRREFDVEDIKMAVFQMQPSTSPGLDGLPSIFFQIFLSIVGEDVLAAIFSFLNLGNLLKKVNFTYITLIPKVKTPKDMSQL
ncbi:hypothetical protein ACFX2H_013250 [Malus domestica]